MKKYVIAFVHRGLMAAGGGPVVWAIVYGILGRAGVVKSLTVNEVCMGILTVTLLAFIAAGVTVVYMSERLPLASAILIHAGAMYLDYLLIYLLNSWIPRSAVGIGIFTAIFVTVFALIWLCVYLGIKIQTQRINEKMKTGRNYKNRMEE